MAQADKTAQDVFNSMKNVSSLTRANLALLYLTVRPYLLAGAKPFASFVAKIKADDSRKHLQALASLPGDHTQLVDDHLPLLIAAIDNADGDDNFDVGDFFTESVEKMGHVVNEQPHGQEHVEQVETQEATPPEEPVENFEQHDDSQPPFEANEQAAPATQAAPPVQSPVPQQDATPPAVQSPVPPAVQSPVPPQVAAPATPAPQSPVPPAAAQPAAQPAPPAPSAPPAAEVAAPPVPESPFNVGDNVNYTDGSGGVHPGVITETNGSVVSIQTAPGEVFSNVGVQNLTPAEDAANPAEDYVVYDAVTVAGDYNNGKAHLATSQTNPAVNPGDPLQDLGFAVLPNKDLLAASVVNGANRPYLDVYIERAEDKHDAGEFVGQLTHPPHNSIEEVSVIEYGGQRYGLRIVSQ